MHVLPNQYAPIRGEAHGDASKGIGRCQPPRSDFADGFVFLIVKLAAEARMGCEIQKLAPEKAELLTKAVDSQNHGGCLNLTLCRAYEDMVAIVDLGHGRVFIKRDICGQIVGKATHQSSRVQQ
jgi:hypothetical protein